jgi:hypothetical protein
VRGFRCETCEQSDGRMCSDTTFLFHVDFVSFLQRTHESGNVLEKCRVVAAFPINQIVSLVSFF